MLPNAIVIGCAAASLASTIGVLAITKLPNRLRALKRSAIVATVCLMTMAVSYGLTARVRSPAFDLARNEAPSHEWFESVHEAQEATQMILPCALFVLAMLLVQIISILTPLRQWIVTQDVDLIARDQIALHKASAQAAPTTAANPS